MDYYLPILEIHSSKMNNNIIVLLSKLLLIKNHKTIRINISNKIRNQYNPSKNKNLIKINLKTRILWKKMSKNNNL